jgi:two-component system cell cycle sensor histidine kinase PleC
MKKRFGEKGGKCAISSYSANLGNAISHKKARIAERAARMEAEQASRMKSSFIANMSHELSTPLNAIIGFSSMLKNIEQSPLEPAQIAEFAAYINDAAEHLLKVVNSILNISKIESGTTVLDVQDVTIAEIVRSAMKFIELKAAEAGVRLHQSYEDDLPIVRGDPVRLKQVYANLVSNAVKFTPRGGTVSAAARRLDERNIIVTIGDTGIGMDENEIEVALSPFGQVDNEFSRRQEGTGLGLAIAKGLIEQHGGRLEISSQKGRGTIVATLLPTARIGGEAGNEANGEKGGGDDGEGKGRERQAA